MRKVKRPKRSLNIGKTESYADRQARTAVRYIMNNPHYKTILSLLRSGAPNNKIAEFCITRGIFDVHYRTAMAYLQYFRKMHPKMCEPVGDENTVGYDHLFDSNKLLVDEETELVRLIHLQKARIGIAFRNEREINIIMNGNRKEIEELRELLVALAKLRGLMGDTVDINLHNYSDAVRDDLKALNQEENQRNVITSLAREIIGASRRD